MKRKIHLEHTFDILPHEHIEAKIDEYALFLKEYNESEKYRLVFSFNPICSNVLFNTITEITKNEGSDNCILFNKETVNFEVVNDEKLKAYLQYTNRINNVNRTNYLTREELILDTGYSHPEIGDFNYHCGYDIFDNHILRSKDFVVVNEMNNTIPDNSRRYFNTISDYLRDSNGSIKKDVNLENHLDTTNILKHLYTTDTLMTYLISINENLTEDNGWLGFVNKGNLQIPNYSDLTINKVINNNDIGAFIDMYPDRSLYSILPKYNKYRKRYEDNWRFCLTYPFENEYDNSLVTEHNYNGIECVFKLDGILQIGTDPNTNIITLRTYVEHGLIPGDTFKLAYFCEYQDGTLIKSGETVNNCIVVDTGSNLYEKKQYIKIRVNDIQNIMSEVNAILDGTYQNGLLVQENPDSNGVFALDRDFYKENKPNIKVKFRFCRTVGENKCKYYIRKFKILTKQDGTKYNYTLNKLAFAKNVYSDRVGEVIFDDIIDITGIKNNLGLPLHEIFISVFKTNHGHEKWYANNREDMVVGDSDIEFSHCFGRLTSGFDMPSDDECLDYNIHRLHNINGNIQGVPLSGKPLEENLCLNTDMDIFYGDLVEFNEKGLSEKTLEDIYYRFNTAQRECTNPIFSTFDYHEVQCDDYDVAASSRNRPFVTTFDIRRGDTGEVSSVPVNLHPEGYFYKAHYRIPLKEYMPRVYWGSDTIMKVNNVTYLSMIPANTTNYFHMTYEYDMYEYEIICDKSYYMTIYDKIYLINKTDVNDIVYGMITSFNDNIYKLVINKNITFNDYKLFKVNPIKPTDAYTLPDASGNYIWRIFKGFNDIDERSELYNRPFTNGTHYLHKDINLYLKRQDPSGVYGLSFNSDMPLFKTNLIVLGNEKDVNNNDYVENITQKQC